MSAQAELAEVICICTGNHNPDKRVECSYAERAAAKVLSAGWKPPSADAEHRLDLLRAVVSYDEVNQSDLPLGLLDSIRAEVSAQ